MTIDIPLIDKWKLKSDKHQFLLVREEENRDFVEGYYSDLEGCVQALVDLKIRGFDSTSIQSLIKSIKSLQTALSKALQPLKLKVVSDKEGF